MEENKLYRIHTENKSNEKTEKKPLFASFHTNPLIQKMLILNINNKKDKFKFKDLFR